MAPDGTALTFGTRHEPPPTAWAMGKGEGERGREQTRCSLKAAAEVESAFHNSVTLYLCGNVSGEPLVRLRHLTRPCDKNVIFK